MTAHTAEPWHTAPSGHILNGARHVLARAFIGNPAMGYPGSVSGAERDANATRIVACVNACVGIPTAELEQIARLNDTLERLRAMRLAIVNVIGPQ